MKLFRNTLNQIPRYLLIMLWVYAAVLKFSDFESAKNEMHNQVFPGPVADILVWLVPLTELLVALLLLIPRTIIAAYCLSAFLLLSFSLYIVFGLLDLYPRMPCSCGGIISQFSWQAHLLFNFFFLALSVTAIITTYKERSSPA